MAFTATLVKQDVHGSQRCVQYSVVADAASGTVGTGLQYIESVFAQAQSCATAGFKVKANLASDGSTTSNGTVFISSAASGDVFFLMVYGR